MKSDIAIAGGGLAGSLIAWRLKTARPDLSVCVIERGAKLGGNHTWSFHATDVSHGQAAWLAPIVVHRWAGQEVRFPNHRRSLATGYQSATSARLHDAVAPLLGEAAIFNADIVELSATAARLADGRVIEADAVIDARGQRPAPALTIGFQKFLGLELRFARPHGLTAPIIMDATVSQSDGYRFVYVLPFTEDTALVEDTYYADGAALDHDGVRAAIDAYCADHGWEVAEILREEAGVLPIALAGDIEAHLAGAPTGVGVAGLGAGLFHPLTGYSLPDAANLADHLAAAIGDGRDLVQLDLAGMTRRYAGDRWRERGFFRLLARFLYYAAEPEKRYKVLARFYRLGQPLIERFYAAAPTRGDKLRTLSGKPPVNFLKAFECLDETAWVERCWEPRLRALAAEERS